MEERIITKGTAKLAKEKGFDIYRNTQYSIGVINPNTTYNYTEEQCKMFRDMYYAPTQSFLQKWLREEHKIEVVAFKNKNGYSVEFDYADKFEIGKLSNYIAYQTYEEAFEIGLQEGLKLM